jgi:predicted transcriptional regulator
MKEIVKNKHVVISPSASDSLDELADKLKLSRKAICEQAIENLLTQIRDGKPETVSGKLEKLLTLFNRQLEELAQ